MIGGDSSEEQRKESPSPSIGSSTSKGVWASTPRQRFTSLGVQRVTLLRQTLPRSQKCRRIDARTRLQLDTQTIQTPKVINHMSGCQNYGPFLDPCYNTAPNIWGTPTGTIILTITHICTSPKRIFLCEDWHNPIMMHLDSVGCPQESYQMMPLPKLFPYFLCTTIRQFVVF